MIYICKKFGKTFDKKQAYAGHCRSHQEKSVHCCNVCGKEFFTTNNGFKHHVNCHYRTKKIKHLGEFNKK